MTALLVLAIGASSALVFTNRVELLKLAVILALWAAVAGAFVSVLYRRQSDADQARVRDLKLVYDLQLDREISARREYELTVESQLRRELASELRAQAADDLAELRAELSALRTSLEILFDTDLAHRPALGTVESEPQPERAYSEWDRNGETPRDNPVDWVPSDRVTSVPQDNPRGRADETAIIDVPEEPLLPPANRRHPVGNGPATSTNRPKNPRIRRRSRPTPTAAGAPVRTRQQPPPQPEPEPQAPPEPEPQPAPRAERHRQDWQPTAAEGQWLPPGTPGSNWTGADAPGNRRRAAARRHSGPTSPETNLGTKPGRIPRRSLGRPAVEPLPQPPYAESGRRARSRHSAEYRDYGVRSFAPGTEPPAPAPPRRPSPGAAGPAAGAPRRRGCGAPPAPEHTPRHGGDPQREDAGAAGETTATGGQSVADLLARLQVQPSEGGRRRRREG
ncbi:putative conserved transmembrane protein rich in alanine, arginine and proline [Mycobacterium intracellulare]|nr:putative conserved transmembrane protein rich in alanine, arginine and proline [Mycobacterium intracellulare]